jgi:arylsulfatase A-like enzyme
LIRGGEVSEQVILGSLRRLEIVESIAEGRWKYIEHATRPGRRMLFDLLEDPGERTDLLARKPRAAEKMAGLLRARRQKNQSRRLETGVATLRKEELERLEALGYGAR